MTKASCELGHVILTIIMSTNFTIGVPNLNEYSSICGIFGISRKVSILNALRSLQLTIYTLRCK